MRENDTTTLYYFELAETINSGASATFSFETVKETPERKNMSDVVVKNETIDKGVMKIYIDGANYKELMFCVFLTSTCVNDRIDYSFKYKTVSAIQEKKYKIDSFTVSNFFSTITLTFTELFKKVGDVSNAQYYLTLYQQSDIKDLTTINNADINNGNKYKSYTKKIFGTNTGKVIKEEIQWTDNMTGKLYARLVVMYISNELEEQVDSFGVLEVKSSTTLFVILLIIGIAIALGVIVVIVMVIFKKKHANQSSDVINKDLKMPLATIANS